MLKRQRSEHLENRVFSYMLFLVRRKGGYVANQPAKLMAKFHLVAAELAIAR